MRGIDRWRGGLIVCLAALAAPLIVLALSERTFSYLEDRKLPQVWTTGAIVWKVPT